MSWTVIIEDENGLAKKTMPYEFILSNYEVFCNENIGILKYLDPYSDTTYNALMREDLVKDLIELKKLLPMDEQKIDIVINYAKECKGDSHTYLKFYGD